MRIAVVANGFPGGSETFILNQVTGLLRRGHDVRLLLNKPLSADQAEALARAGQGDVLARTCWNRAGEPGRRLRRLTEGVRTLLRESRLAPAFALRLLSGRGRGVSWSLLAALQGVDRGFDIIHCHYGGNGVRAERLRRLGALGGQLVTVFHGYDVAKAGDGRYAALFRRGQLFLPVSRLWRDRLMELGCPPDRLAVHRMGVDCRRFAYRPRSAQPGRAVRIVSVGRLVEKKGFQHAVPVVAALQAQGWDIDYRIVGDGPLRGTLARLAAGAPGSIRLLGWQPPEAVAGILDDADLFLAPSLTGSDGDQEGVPVSIMEAMARGLPVVSTRHSGIPELVEHGVSGFLAEEGSRHDLAVQLTSALQAQARWAELGCNGRRRVEQDYDVEKLNDALVRRFEALLEPGMPDADLCAPARGTGQ